MDREEQETRRERTKTQESEQCMMVILYNRTSIYRLAYG